jgi:hypothetical protein
MFSWPANSDGVKPGISERWPKLDAGPGDYFLEVVDPRTGKILGAAVVRAPASAHFDWSPLNRAVTGWSPPIQTTASWCTRWLPVNKPEYCLAAAR